MGNLPYGMNNIGNKYRLPLIYTLWLILNLLLTSSDQISHVNDIIMSYAITHQKISVYKQGVMSQQPDFKSHLDRVVSG